MDSRTKQMILQLSVNISLWTLVYQGGDGASTGCFEPPLEEGHCFHLLGWFGLFFVITNVETCGESIHYGLNINKASLFHCKSKR
ncbi:hypothetical protein F2Q68_00035670 [Brassica cretica]|uniref:Uncharacterized protein n=2 Tax=Brassica cretica TaxID=69181 RepID=A0A8S9H2Z3_BRACR|nr:hypothetical protein F2Q68_00035670 [Brassica cretica]KAF3596119.1 hypothetical protein DY000_02024295 [Brassica cretica]